MSCQADIPATCSKIVALTDNVKLDQVRLMEMSGIIFVLVTDTGPFRVSIIQQHHAAVLRAVPKVNRVEADVSLYQLKWVEWKSGFSPIVTQVST